MTTNDDDYFNDMSHLLATNEFSKMTGVQLALSTLPITTAPTSSTESSLWTNENLSLLQRADIVCFTNHIDVQSYLDKLDEHMGIPKDMKEEDRRKLPNKPKSTDDDDNGDTGSTIMTVACPDFQTARECLQSGRWISNHIYYPKNEEKMKGDGNDGGVEEADSINVEAWVNSIVQAAGDVTERKFWGGGW
jgi:hypothetical protein